MSIVAKVRGILRVPSCSQGCLVLIKDSSLFHPIISLWFKKKKLFFHDLILVLTQIKSNSIKWIIL